MELGADNISTDPLKLPQGFSWTENPSVEKLFAFLSENYIEDADGSFRLYYGPDFLQWALYPPGYRPNWIITVNKGENIIGSITAIPANICVNGKQIRAVEINFLCVHKSARDHRLTPVLIAEITRRVNIDGIFHAVYTRALEKKENMSLSAGLYWHRIINVKKLVKIGFTSIQPNTTLTKTIKLAAVPRSTSLPLRQLICEDIPAANKFLSERMDKFSIRLTWNDEEFAHWFLPRSILATYVTKNVSGDITGLVSFYHLQTLVIGTSEVINAAYLWYVAGDNHIKLVSDAITIAARECVDVFNCLDIQDNWKHLESLKFKPGTGLLGYYLFGETLDPVPAKSVGIVMF